MILLSFRRILPTLFFLTLLLFLHLFQPFFQIRNTLCILRVIFCPKKVRVWVESRKQPLTEMQSKTAYNRPLWFGSSPNNAHSKNLVHRAAFFLGAVPSCCSKNKSLINNTKLEQKKDSSIYKASRVYAGPKKGRCTQLTLMQVLMVASMARIRHLYVIRK